MTVKIGPSQWSAIVMLLCTTDCPCYKGAVTKCEHERAKDVIRSSVETVGA